jgi:hypothetical protein
MGKGLCKKCYPKKYVKENLEHERERKRQWYLESRKYKDYRIKGFVNKNGEEALNLIQNPNTKCFMCGSTDGLQIHHKDHKGCNVPSSERNNSIDNLEVLCISCHTKKHHSLKLKNKWAKNYDCCVMCGKTNKPHLSHGYCSGCLHKRNKPERKWAKVSKYECCVQCLSTTRKHKGNGLCDKCYDRKRATKRKINKQLSTLYDKFNKIIDKKVR